MRYAVLEKTLAEKRTLTRHGILNQRPTAKCKTQLASQFLCVSLWQAVLG